MLRTLAVWTLLSLDLRDTPAEDIALFRQMAVAGYWAGRDNQSNPTQQQLSMLWKASHLDPSARMSVDSTLQQCHIACHINYLNPGLDLKRTRERMCAPFRQG